jgi:putative MATE family efflux protein
MLHRLRARLPLLGTVWRLALPVILSNVLISLVNVVDIFMVGRLGPLEIAAVGMATSVRMLVLIGIMSVTAGAMALAAQAYGARDARALSHVARQSLSLTVLLALLLSAVGWALAEPLLGALNSGGDPQAAALGAEYVQILFLGTVLLALNLVLNSLMQGAGDTMTPLYITAGANVLNILFNYLFMFGPGPLPALGVAGAAVGTLIARFVASVIGLLILYSGRNPVHILPGSYRPDWAMFRDILAIGVPSGLQGVARNGAQVLLLGIVTSTAAGTYGAAALAIGLQIESLAFMPGLAISVAATSLVGQALGTWDPQEARRRGDTAIILGVLVMSLAAVPIFVLAPQILRLFDPSAHPTVVAAGTSYLRINALFLPLLAVAMVTNGTLRGAGDTRPGLVGTVIGRCIIVVPLAHLLALTLDFGVVGVWWALCVGTTIQALWVALRWRGTRWQGVALRKTALYRQHLRELPERVQRRFLEEVRTPLMARLGANEAVEEGGVRYTLPEGRGAAFVRFRADAFEITEGREHLQHPPRTTLPKFPKAAYAHD